MKFPENIILHGQWISGSHRGRRARVVGFRAGLLLTSSVGLVEESGRPEMYLCDNGETGIDLLDRLLLPPTTSQLRNGAVRESIASVRSVARFGFSESRSWDGDDYIVDGGDGAAAVVRFLDDECIGALVSVDPSRPFSPQEALGKGGEEVSRRGTELLSLPFLAAGAMAPVTAVFWSESGVVSSSEPWRSVCEFGGEILDDEMKSDNEWITNNLLFTPSEAREVTRISRERISTPMSEEIHISSEAWDLLTADGSHRRDAVTLMESLRISRMRESTVRVLD